ncbi:MAG: hypothetical protein Q9214_004029 [Letrouitia sp. 1 TL-2023]
MPELRGGSGLGSEAPGAVDGREVDTHGRCRGAADATLRIVGWKDGMRWQVCCFGEKTRNDDDDDDDDNRRSAIKESFLMQHGLVEQLK